ncbi:RES family NAD+ phosphorylase [Actinokineospora iranica]|uniref:RES domain-containing protein n=1 Tax=Actinokineospora iranica TaxID=1271860 RepID=A0A1G6QCA2_9PSEU|nr:RES family NAD+ phosphorylase [Actinokineospora iranica]SDC89534.1 hypothetical protein SAMN05216174_105188 [Actinokineospora iranica]
MPDHDPPAAYTGAPRRRPLPEDTVLWRIHGKKQRPTDFSPPAKRFTGARFEGAPHDPYPTHRGGTDAAAIIAETLLHGVPLDDKAFRTVRRVAVAGRRISALSTVRELDLVSLCDGPDLAAVGQNAWLVVSAESDSPRLRRWATWLREQAPTAHGLLWPPRRAPGHRLVVLFGDRVDGAVFDPDPLFSLDLDDECGALWLNALLVSQGARVMPPRARTGGG